MKTLFRLYFLTLLMIFASANAQAQDPFYSQIFSNRLQLNPALAGSQGAAYVMTQYRAQWVNIPGFYKQLGIAYDQPIGKGWALGLNTQYYFGGGGFTASNFQLHIAKEFKIGKNHFVRAGLSGGINLQTIDYYKLRFPDQIDPRTGFVTPAPTSGYEHFPVADFNTGLVYYNRLFFFSASARHIQGGAFTEVGQTYINTLYTATTGFRIPIGPLALSPLAHFQQQGDYDKAYMFGLAVEMNKIQLITWLQPEARFSIGLGTTLGPVQLAYQYDHYTTDIARIAGSTHELSLGFRLGGKEKRQRSAMPMPLF